MYLINVYIFSIRSLLKIFILLNEQKYFYFCQNTLLFDFDYLVGTSIFISSIQIYLFSPQFLPLFNQLSLNNSFPLFHSHQLYVKKEKNKLLD